MPWSRRAAYWRSRSDGARVQIEHQGGRKPSLRGPDVSDPVHTRLGCLIWNCCTANPLPANDIRRDNMLLERLRWSIKYEDVYMRAYDSIRAAHQGLGLY